MKKYKALDRKRGQSIAINMIVYGITGIFLIIKLIISLINKLGNKLNKK